MQIAIESEPSVANNATTVQSNLRPFFVCFLASVTYNFRCNLTKGTSMRDVPEISRKEVMIMRVIDWAQKHAIPVDKLTPADILLALKSRT